MKLDLHVHSSYSFDSTMEPGEIIETAISRGLDGVAVVDHDTALGGLKAAELAVGDFIVIPGMEVTTPLGHIIGLFLKENISARDPANVIDEIHEQGGLAIFPHPINNLRLMPRYLLSEFDAMEAHNARNGSFHQLCLRYGENNIRRISDENEMALLGVSDAHFPVEIGRGVTIVEGSSADETKAAITERKTAFEGETTSRAYRFMSGTLKIARKLKELLKPKLD